MVVHADKIRWLFWARWKMLTRGFARNRASLIGSIIFLLVVVFFAGWAAFGTYFAYRALPTPANSEVLYLVLTGLFVLWIVLPLLEFSSNEGLDISKLTLFPLTRAELMVSLLFSTLLDVPTVGLFLLMAAIVAGWAVSVPVAILALVTMLIFYIQLVGISQLVLALFMRTLQSRRFRDLSIIIIAVFTSSCYLMQQLVLGGTRVLRLYDNLLAGSYSPYLQWLPSGFAARAIQQAVLGNWGASLASVGLLLVVSVALLYLWQAVLQRSLSASEVGGSARTRNQRRQQVAVSPVDAGAINHAFPTAWHAVQDEVRLGVWQSEYGPRAPTMSANLWNRLLPPQVTAIAVKELKYFWRDPQLKALLFQSVVYVAIFIIGPLVNPNSGGFGKQYILFISPLVVLLFLTSISLNSLGLERQGLTTTFLFPIEPQRLLWGKNLAVAALGIGELILLIGVGAFLSQAWDLVLPVAILGLAGMGVTLGCGNFTSVYFPQYMRQMQRGFRATGTTSQSGCLRGVMSLVMLLVTALLVAPVALGLFLPLFFHAQWVWTITMPLSLVYGIAFHQIATRLVAPRIVERAPEILAVTTRE